MVSPSSWPLQFPAGHLPARYVPAALEGSSRSKAAATARSQSDVTSTRHELMVDLGATVAIQPEPPDPHLTVMLVPAGHPFCLIPNAAATRF